MMPTDTKDRTKDPLEMLNRALGRAWEVVCEPGDVTVGLPSMLFLFQGADISIPAKAAKTVMANMLMEVMENVGRFSPMYKMPARTYGLISIRDRQSDKMLWSLAPEASQRWCDLLEELAIAIRKNSALIQATVLVDGLLAEGSQDCVITVSCSCLPPRKLQAKFSELDQADIICDACRHPFT